MKRKSIVMLVLTLTVMAVGVFLWASYQGYFYRFHEINPANEVTGPFLSPDGKYSANSYYRPYGGAAGGVTYYVQVEEVETGEKKTIYESEHHYDFTMRWTGPETLAITNESPEYQVDRSVELQVATEIYEESGRACRSFYLKGTYEKCYSK